MQCKMKRNWLLSIAICLVFVLVVGMMPGTVSKAATSYSGSGTMADPYLVQTAEQLQGMRDNLSAHYKLANTIDLSGIDFKPIGRLDAPFTGSFLCELNADLTPKYVIKNLAVTVAATYNKDTFVTKKGKMEAGLFGAIDGATLSGIYVLDAKIVNNNYGDNDGNVAYNNYLPGMSEMSAGILAGHAFNATIMNCGTTGSIESKCNYCGGLAGKIGTTNISNSYSTANVYTIGKWSSAGFVGAANDSTVTTSFATGNATGGMSSVAAFIGRLIGACTVSDCYSTGDVKGLDVNATNASYANPPHFTSWVAGTPVNITNCYTYGRFAPSGSVMDGSYTASNCWATDDGAKVWGKAAVANGIKVASQSQIKTAFAGLANWDTSGDKPVLTTIGVVTDASKYVPGAVSETPGTTGNAQGGSQAGNQVVTQSGTTTTVTVTPEEVAAMIEALPTPTEENPITLESKDAVIEAWEAYNSLSAGEKDDFNADLSAKLNSVRYQMSILVAGELVKAVKALPAIENLTADDVEKILALYKDYQFLDEAVIAELDDSVITKIEAAYEFAQNAQAQGAVTKIETELTLEEKIIVGICIAVIVLLLIGYTIVLVILLRKICVVRKKKRKGEKSHVDN